MPAKRKKVVPKRSTAPRTKRRSTPSQRSRKQAGEVPKFVLPLVLSLCLVICLAVIGVLGMRSVAASPFFNVRNISIDGVHRASKGDIERVVSTQTERSGTWNADLADIRQRIEKLTFVKTASVSRVLPGGISVRVFERVPQAIARIGNKDFLVDADGEVLAPVDGSEESLPFSMTGWDETKTERAFKDNMDRVKLYQKMLEQWKSFDLASRVRMVDLSDLRDAKAVTADSGQNVTIGLGNGDFGDHLRSGISAIVGKGDVFEGVELRGANMILTPRKKQPDTADK